MTAVVAGLIVATLVAACGGTSGSSGGSGAAPPSSFKPGALNRQFAGHTIHVLLPPWGNMPQSQLKKFTAETGIKVDLQTLAWDSIHNKVATSEAAGVSPADVTEVDWSWVGQFGAAGWYTPLQKWLSPSTVNGSPVAPVFVYHGKRIAMPYNIDFRATTINWTDFKKAGISTIPTSWAGLLKDAQQLKAKGVVQTPVGVPLSTTEGTSTPWYALVKSAGGQVLSSSNAPAFATAGSAGADALNYELALYRDKLIPPGEVGLTDVQTESLFESGQVAILLSFTPGALPVYKDPKQSKVAHDSIRMIPLPGTHGHRTGTFGLPEGLGIPKQSKQKGAAAEFITWWEQRPQLITSYTNASMGNLPPQTSTLRYLTAHGKLVGGHDILGILPTVKPLFPQGTP
ncbi:MAG: ABC transporter substrate-binding protein, partial [Acidimicrobiales bacterium]